MASGYGYQLNEAQRAALAALCELHEARFRAGDFRPVYGLPEGWVAGRVGERIYVRCDPRGRITRLRDVAGSIVREIKQFR